MSIFKTMQTQLNLQQSHHNTKLSQVARLQPKHKQTIFLNYWASRDTSVTKAGHNYNLTIQVGTSLYTPLHYIYIYITTMLSVFKVTKTCHMRSYGMTMFILTFMAVLINAEEIFIVTCWSDVRNIHQKLQCCVLVYSLLVYFF